MPSSEQVVCFFQSGQKFKSRYATLGFQQAANLDDGDIWPTSFALTRLTAAVEERIGKLVKKAASRGMKATTAVFVAAGSFGPGSFSG